MTLHETRHEAPSSGPSTLKLMFRDKQLPRRLSRESSPVTLSPSDSDAVVDSLSHVRLSFTIVDKNLHKPVMCMRSAATLKLTSRPQENRPPSSGPMARLEHQLLLLSNESLAILRSILVHGVRHGFVNVRLKWKSTRHE